MSISKIRLPEPLSTWPLPRKINPHYAEVKADCVAWIHSFNALSPKAQKAFDRCDFSLLGALCYPTLDKERFRTACDLMMLFFIFDEFTDQVDRHGAKAYVDITMDALRNPHTPRPEGEHVLGEITRQFFALAIKTASVSSQRHFLRTFEDYVMAVIEEADDRINDRIRGIDAYMSLRRQTAGGYPACFPCELKLDLPEEVIAHPAIVNLERCIADSVVLINVGISLLLFDHIDGLSQDACSYNIEQASGHHVHNIVTVVMHELDTTLDAALEWVHRRHTAVLAEFIDGRNNLPSFGSAELDRQVAEYVENIGHEVRGLESWCFESRRYFGDRGLEVQKHRIVELLPKVGKDNATPMMAQMMAVASRS
ncbi:terpenoid synthase [Artomyces pyxidatus]|uniref:Terpenoid synthase n=1 Tax=Artomyces pyxidatus TaxID=48021 RepID=A0ACB8T1J3_9AGAM|nr:terpenoid synthase [Artomyces pyxidatus]